MIEDKEVKIAESPEEAMHHRALENTEQRMREMKFALELDQIVLEYLKNKKSK